MQSTYFGIFFCHQFKDSQYILDTSTFESTFWRRFKFWESPCNILNNLSHRLWENTNNTYLEKMLFSYKESLQINYKEPINQIRNTCLCACVCVWHVMGVCLC